MMKQTRGGVSAVRSRAAMGVVAGAVLALAAGGVASGQPTSDSPLAPAPNGIRRVEATGHAWTGATLHTAPGRVIEGGVLVIADGLVARADATRAAVPAGASAHDGAGLHIYPAFIDAWVEVQAPLAADSGSPTSHYSRMVTPGRSALDGPGLSNAARASHRGLGFGAAAIVPEGGIFAGLSAVVSLADTPGDASAQRPEVYRANAFHAVDFDRSGGDPNSHPGIVARMRQTLSDAAWQAAQTGPSGGAGHAPTALDVLEPVGPGTADGAHGHGVDAPLFFDCALDLEHFLAASVAGEFGREYVLVGNGTEFRWLDGLASLGAPMVVPLRFPEKPDVSTPGHADAVELETMMVWEHAPANAGYLASRGVELAITATMLPEGRDFRAELRKAISHGLSEEGALRALTTTPAELLGVGDQLGTLEPGKRANFIVADGPIFAEKTKILEVWIDGARHRINDPAKPDLDGSWAFAVLGAGGAGGESATIEITGSASRPGVTFKAAAGDAAGDGAGDGAGGAEGRKAREVKIGRETISFLIDEPAGARADGESGGSTIVSGVVVSAEEMRGTLLRADQSGAEWRATRTAGAEKKEEEPKGAEAVELPPLPGYPFGPYAVAYDPADLRTLPLLLEHATVWTQTEAGTIEDGYVLVEVGKVRRVGPMSELAGRPISPATVRVDATGRHVTPGLIDAHSHTSLFGFGVNETGQAVTAEVRIGDAIDPSAINWYRQLAHGVTTVLSLHGSANPIGGQSQTTKVRWGAIRPTDFFMEGSKPGIKFALGENVVRSPQRYPNTRMGVESLIRDRFTEARAYLEARGRAGEGTRAPRRDLELEALAEILAGERLVHSHSYRQDEILMLARVARDFGFKIGTFQHGLEVYKVAEAVKGQAIGASIFSDWWNYKVEVQDAIPYAGPLQSEVGVLTSFNSDSDELSRRMNLEAAKVLAYSRRDGSGRPVFTREQALAFVTSNPAKQMGVGDRIGSIAVGMDADLVVWSGDPLSSYSMVERVYVDGRERFSLESDLAMRERVRGERSRLIQKIVKAKGAGEKKDGAEKKEGAEKADGPENPGGAGVRGGARAGILARAMGYDAGVWGEGFGGADRPFPEYPRPGECGCAFHSWIDSEREYNR